MTVVGGNDLESDLVGREWWYWWCETGLTGQTEQTETNQVNNLPRLA